MRHVLLFFSKLIFFILFLSKEEENLSFVTFQEFRVRDQKRREEKRRKEKGWRGDWFRVIIILEREKEKKKKRTERLGGFSKDYQRQLSVSVDNASLIHFTGPAPPFYFLVVPQNIHLSISSLTSLGRQTRTFLQEMQSERGTCASLFNALDCIVLLHALTAFFPPSFLLSYFWIVTILYINGKKPTNNKRTVQLPFAMRVKMETIEIRRNRNCRWMQLRNSQRTNKIYKSLVVCMCVF